MEPSKPSREPEPNSLADRTLDRLIGVDQIRFDLDQSHSGSPKASGAEWDSANRRFRGVLGRFSNRLRPRSARVDAGPGVHWVEYLIDALAWLVMAAILAAFLYVVYRGLQIAGMA
jgi:hypothetical protein